MAARQHDDPVRWADPIRVLHEETEHADVQNLRLLEPVSGRLLFHRHVRAIDLQQVIAASDQPKQLRAERGRVDDGIVGGDDVAVPEADRPSADPAPACEEETRHRGRHQKGKHEFGSRGSTLMSRAASKTRATAMATSRSH